MTTQLSQLEQLKTMSIVVADTGEFNLIAQFKPEDATTNPSLIFTALSSKPEQYMHLADEAIDWARKRNPTDPAKQLEDAMDRVLVDFGTSILKIVPGLVSTEIDARLSFDTEACIARVHKLAGMYQETGIDPKKRVLFKLASTWEGIRAAEKLQKEGYHCNMTLLFSFVQAVACADAGATLISPFVGRLWDFATSKDPTLKTAPYDPEKDPGVKSVRQIYAYYKKYGIKTVVMGASFRNAQEVLALSGSDKLTISPELLAKLAETKEPIKRALDPAESAKLGGPQVHFDEKAFRFAVNDDEAAEVKLADGIRRFVADTIKLEKIMRDKIAGTGGSGSSSSSATVTASSTTTTTTTTEKK